MAAQLDELDRKILSELQPMPSSRWTKSREGGVVQDPGLEPDPPDARAGGDPRTTAILDPEALGLEACFFVLIRTSEHEADWQRKFLKALKERPKCWRRTGLRGISTIS
jgi:Lrp/AsnC family transcriptional regulator